MKVIILAGGSGERFWPLSTSETPKQFLKFFGEKTLLRQTFERINSRICVKDVFIVTLDKYLRKTEQELPELPKQNILLEPLKRNTAPACVLGMLSIKENDEIVLVVPADHYIPEWDIFWENIKKAETFLTHNEGIITFGIVPTRPEAEYGYIETAEQVDENIFAVKTFREKPNYDTAVKFINRGNFYWNSGIFMWQKKFFLKEMEKHAYDVIRPFFELEDISEIYSKVPSISIDYALMEKVNKVYMVKANFIWSDVGNWKSLQELGVQNSEQLVLVDSKNVFARTTKPTIIVGINNLVVIETENGILISNDRKFDKIREGVSKLTEQK